MNILKLLKSESRRTDFVFPDFIERHGSELMLDIDRAEWFIYSDSDEQWKADTIIDLYSTKEELESERVRSGNRPDPYSVYLNHVSTSSSLDRESFNSLFSCMNVLTQRQKTQSIFFLTKTSMKKECFVFLPQ